MEAHAIGLARGAGAILSRHFGASLDVEYKQTHHRDPVTKADKECQAYLTGEISAHYPDHGIIGEEDEREDDSPAPDFVWVVDPLDGTTNFLSGLPLFACSIGVLHRGAPIAGAIYIPWPARDGGLVMHARKGGGAFVEEERLSVYGGEEPEGHRLASLPGSFGSAFRLGRPMRGRVGDVRVTGSIAYEMALTAMGVLQYSIINGPRLWDVAGGVSLVMEAGGAALVGQRGSARGLLRESRIRWEPLESFVPRWREGETTLAELRQWSARMVLGSPGIARYVAANLRSRSSLRSRLHRAARRMTRRSRPGEAPG
jgi:myo-inositol-1(or 4)-monophosphatase